MPNVNLYLILDFYVYKLVTYVSSSAIKKTLWYIYKCWEFKLIIPYIIT